MKQHTTHAQITIFVIIGALLLLSVGIVLVTTSDLVRDDPGVDIPDVSLEARPAIELITTCLDSTAKEALVAIGRQGGSLAPPSVKYPSYKSEAIEFTPDVVPYWRYLESGCTGNDCERTQQPPLCKPSSTTCLGLSTTGSDLPAVEAQLEKYVIDSIDSCIDEFSTIGEQYDITVDGQPQVRVIFGDDDTSFVLNYPITITSLSTENTKLVDEYQVTYDVSLKQMYATAQEIIEFARATDFYERVTMNLIDVYADLDSELPPTSELSLRPHQYGPWVRPVVEEILQYDVFPFMQLITFVNTPNYRPIFENTQPTEYTQYMNGIYQFMQPKTSDNMLDYAVSHKYTYDPIFLQVDDGDTLIKAKNPVDTDNPILELAGFFLKDYRFDYYTSYPLIIAIEDADALNGEGYTFQFGYEVNIRANQPGYGNVSVYNFDRLVEPSLSNFEVLLPQNITVEAKDRRTGQPLADVIVSYQCGEEYVMGSTQLNAQGRAIVTGQLPYCEYGGYIAYTKDGYLGQSVPFDNRLDGVNARFTVELWPVQEKQVIIRKRSLADQELLLGSSTDTIYVLESAHHELDDLEEGLVTIERQFTTPYDDPVPLVSFAYKRAVEEGPIDQFNQLVATGYQSGSISSDDYDVLLDEINSIDPATLAAEEEETIIMGFVPGTYLLDGTMIYRGSTYIPEAKIEEGGFLGIGGVEETLPSQNFTSWVNGGVALNFTLSEAEVYNDHPLTVYLLEMPRPTSWEEMFEIKTPEEYQQGKESWLYPVVGAASDTQE